MFTKMKLAGIERNVPTVNVAHYESFGWERVVPEAQGVINPEPKAVTVDAGAIVAKPPKKKKSEKTAETATEAAPEDQGNDISKGE